jgi:hypothetical protein
VRECAGQINMLLSNLVWGRTHIMCADNSPYLDPSPCILQAWKALDAQMGGVEEAKVMHVGQQAGARAVAVASAAAAGPAGSGGLGIVDRKAM